LSVLILPHDRTTLYPLCSAHFKILRQRHARSRQPDAAGGNSPKYSMTIFSVITIISTMRWSCGLDTQFGKSVIPCHLICYP
jgi:hypothetical protein